MDAAIKKYNFYVMSERKTEKVYIIPEAVALQAKIEKDIMAELKEKISFFGEIAGVEWNDKLIHRKDLKEFGVEYQALKYIGAYLFCILFSWYVFDNPALGFIFGASIASGGIAVSSAGNSDGTRIAELVKDDEV